MIGEEDVRRATEPDAVQVVVVGAGPTGATAAALLARYGVNSLVLERFPEIYPLPRAVHLDDEVVRILQQAGVAGGFMAATRPTLGLQLVDGAHRVLARFVRDRTLGVHGYPEANMFDQPDLERLLRARLADDPRVRLVTGAEVVAVEQPATAQPGDTQPGTGQPVPAPVRVTYRDREGRQQTVWAQAVLGCDGANSDVRAMIGSKWTDLGFQERWLVIDVTSAVPLDAWDGVHQVCDPRRPATFMRVGADRYRWEFRLGDGEDASALLVPDRLAALIAPWTGGVPAAALHVLRTAEYVFAARIADRWRERRVFLLGDAAHQTPPFIGQGLGTGLRDAHNLAWKLALVLGQGADDRLLDSYQSERVPHARAMIRLAVIVGRLMNGGQDRAAAVRAVALAVLGRVPGVSALVLRSAMPALRPGPLVLPHGRVASLLGRDLAGTIIPQPWVVAGGRRQRLDDVLGESFSILADGPISEGLRALADRVGALPLQLDPLAPTGAGIPVDAPALRAWLAARQTRAVLLRPDRVVLWAESSLPRVPVRRARRLAAARYVTGWLPPVR